jgi:O-antigen ligase
MQHFSGSPVLPTDSPNGYLQVMSWDFMGSIRAFSLFSSPAMFGHFLALIAGLGLAYWLGEKGSTRKGVALTLLALLGGFATLTRATEFEITGVMITVWMFYRSKSPRLLSLLPLVYGVFGILLAYVVPLLGTLYSDDLLSGASLMERYIGWARYGSLWIGNGLATFLLGAGLAQNDRFRPGEGVVVDNSYIGVGVHIGFIGVVLWVAITWVIWKYMLDEARRLPSALRAAALGAYSVWLFTSVFGINLFSPLPFVLFLQTGLRFRRRLTSSPASVIPKSPGLPGMSGIEGGPLPGPA